MSAKELVGTDVTESEEVIAKEYGDDASATRNEKNIEFAELSGQDPEYFDNFLQNPSDLESSFDGSISGEKNPPAAETFSIGSTHVTVTRFVMSVFIYHCVWFVVAR